MDDFTEDPFCKPDQPTTINFEDITSAAYKIRSGINLTQCIVSNKHKYSVHKWIFWTDKDILLG